jgi:hypothetical protein
MAKNKVDAVVLKQGGWHTHDVLLLRYEGNMVFLDKTGGGRRSKEGRKRRMWWLDVRSIYMLLGQECMNKGNSINHQKIHYIITRSSNI